MDGEYWIEKRIASVSHDYYFIITKCELKPFINRAFVLVAAVNEPFSGLKLLVWTFTLCSSMKGPTTK